MPAATLICSCHKGGCILNNMLKAAIPDEKICEIAECTQETIDNIRKNNRENNGKRFLIF
jgi:hypothetical protein